ncbi:tubulin polyglutamylase complex subunit 2 isoform X5 [Ailuropoda melanoleuca]|uniref:tubulin polyglutamylase complex subunit 2 isoform X5 n=1 Tax=Ailuropoda melanoleuca TaxID=9646 RepID=UPI001494EC78|nr:tubulin polyglutamylase complex subunit 2 isoform X5 [Ailuropoda melanoleuca]
MEETQPPGCSKPHLEKLTLGITRILESSPGVTEVTIVEKPPAERHMISSWEQKNNCVLPEDVKNFYLMTNGFHMTWSVKLDEHTIPLGSMAINSISKLTQLNQSSVYSLPNAPTLADLEDDALEGSLPSLIQMAAKSCEQLGSIEDFVRIVFGYISETQVQHLN